MTYFSVFFNAKMVMTFPMTQQQKNHECFVTEVSGGTCFPKEVVVNGAAEEDGNREVTID